MIAMDVHIIIIIILSYYELLYYSYLSNFWEMAGPITRDHKLYFPFEERLLVASFFPRDSCQLSIMPNQWDSAPNGVGAVQAIIHWFAPTSSFMMNIPGSHNRKLDKIGDKWLKDSLMFCLKKNGCCSSCGGFCGSTIWVNWDGNAKTYLSKAQFLGISIGGFSIVWFAAGSNWIATTKPGRHIQGATCWHHLHCLPGIDRRG